MNFIISNNNEEIPQGYHKPDNETIINHYFSFDRNGDCNISKNEWMISFIKLLGNDMESLEKEGPDAIMTKIKELSDEFDYYDENQNKYLELQEFKQIIENHLYISE